MQAYIEMIQEEEKEKWGDAYLPPSNENPAGSQGMKAEGSGKETPPPIPRATKPPPPRTQSAPIVDLSDSDSDDVLLSSQAGPKETWTCPICTLENPPTYLCCDACTTERPGDTFLPQSRSREQPSSRSSQSQPSGSSTGSIKASSKQPSRSIRTLSALDAAESKKPLGWVCHRCGTFMESEWWTCASCGTMKLSS